MPLTRWSTIHQPELQNKSRMVSVVQKGCRTTHCGVPIPITDPGWGELHFVLTKSRWWLLLPSGSGDTTWKFIGKGWRDLFTLTTRICGALWQQSNWPKINLGGWKPWAVVTPRINSDQESSPPSPMPYWNYQTFPCQRTTNLHLGKILWLVKTTSETFVDIRVSKPSSKTRQSRMVMPQAGLK